MGRITRSAQHIARMKNLAALEFLMNEKFHEAMFNFQYLELMLQEALRTFESLIEYKMRGILNYQVDGLGIERSGLRRLADKYAKYTNDDKFKSDVNEVIKARNQLAHRLFLSAEVHNGSSSEEIRKEVEEALLQSETASRLGDEVFAKMQNYFFDHVKQEWHLPS